MRRGPVGQQGNQPPSNPLHRLHRLHRLHQLLQVPPRRSAHPRATVKTSRTATSGGLGLPLTIFYYQQGPRYILHILRRLATLSTIVSIIFFFFRLSSFSFYLFGTFLFLRLSWFQWRLCSFIDVVMAYNRWSQFLCKHVNCYGRYSLR